MALSGTTSTGKYDGRYYTVTWTATQSATNNTSTISWTLKAVGGNSNWYAERTLKVVIGGSTVVDKTDRVERYAGIIATGSKVIKHDSNGDASFNISIKAAVCVTDVNLSVTQTNVLDNIPKKSTLDVEDGTLGVEQTLTVTKVLSRYTHTIVASCGSASVTVCSKSSDTSVLFTPPLGWANNNTIGDSVSVTYVITTYDGNSSLGKNSYTVSCLLPSSLRPSCSVAVTDPMGYAETYGGFIKGLSKFKVDVTASTSYGSDIVSYSTTANGSTYTEKSFTTEVLKSSGTLTVKATVKDRRSRTGSASVKNTVFDYSPPIISELTVGRCNSNGNENDQGEYVKVTFSSEIASINNKNNASYKLEYKKTSDSGEPTEIELSNYAGNYTVTGGTYIFAADTGSSYEVKVIATDDFSSTSRTTSVSTGSRLFTGLQVVLELHSGKLLNLQMSLILASMSFAEKTYSWDMIMTMKKA